MTWILCPSVVYVIDKNKQTKKNRDNKNTKNKDQTCMTNNNSYLNTALQFRNKSIGKAFDTNPIKVVFINHKVENLNRTTQYFRANIVVTVTQLPLLATESKFWYYSLC